MQGMVAASTPMMMRSPPLLFLLLLLLLQPLRLAAALHRCESRVRNCATPRHRFCGRSFVLARAAAHKNPTCASTGTGVHATVSVAFVGAAFPRRRLLHPRKRGDARRVQVIVPNVAHWPARVHFAMAAAAGKRLRDLLPFILREHVIVVYLIPRSPRRLKTVRPGVIIQRQRGSEQVLEPEPAARPRPPRRMTTVDGRRWHFMRALAQCRAHTRLPSYKFSAVILKPGTWVRYLIAC